jgi:hypothetical protein
MDDALEIFSPVLYGFIKTIISLFFRGSVYAKTI